MKLTLGTWSPLYIVQLDGVGSRAMVWWAQLGYFFALCDLPFSTVVHWFGRREMMLRCCAQCCPIHMTAKPGWEHGGTVSNPLHVLRDRVKGSPQILTAMESLSLLQPPLPCDFFSQMSEVQNCSLQWGPTCLLTAAAVDGRVKCSGCSLEWPPCHPRSAPDVCIDTQASLNALLPMLDWRSSSLWLHTYCWSPEPSLRHILVCSLQWGSTWGE